MRLSLGSLNFTAGLLLAFMGLTSAMFAPACHAQRSLSQGTALQGTGAKWISTGQLNVARSNHTATLLRDGRVLVAGGQSDSPCCLFTSQASAEIYDPVRGTWSVTGSMLVPRSGHTATLLLDGRVLVIGGQGLNAPLAELYDPSTGSWLPLTGLDARVGYSVTLLSSGKVLVAGGYYGGYQNSAEIFDLATGKWSYTGNLIAVRAGHTATLLHNGKVLVAGGEDGNNPNDINDIYVLKSTELYDPVAGTWSRGADLNAGFDDHLAVLMADGKVMVLGSFGFSDMPAPEEYDPDAGTWTNTSSPSRYHHGFSATSLADGTVLIAGGEGTLNDYLTTADVYDDRSGTWSTTADMIAGRWGHTATLLADGRVLVAGGLGEGTTGEITLRSAELYVPAVVPMPGAIGPGYTGSWYDPAQSGHGLVVEVLSDNRFYVNWFAFDLAGTQQAWFTGVGTYSGNTATITDVEQPTGGRWIPNFDPAQVVRNAWGTLTFTFSDCDHGRVDFNSIAGYGSGSMNLTRLTQPAGLSCP